MSEDKKIIISENELKQLCKEEFMNNIKDNMDSSIIFTYVRGLEKGIIKYKEVLDKIKEKCKEEKEVYFNNGTIINGLAIYILELLEEIE